MMKPSSWTMRCCLMCGIGTGMVAGGCQTITPSLPRPAPPIPSATQPSGIARVSYHHEGPTAPRGSTPAAAPISRTAYQVASSEPKLLGANAPATAVPLGSPPLEFTLIDLGAALSQAGVNNPTIELAQEQVREAEGLRTAANAMLLPDLNVGGMFHLHRGYLEASTGLIRTVNSQSLYFGAGARTLAAETIGIPGVRIYAHLGEAFTEPQVASRRVGARTATAQATQNATLLETSAAYLRLAGADAQVEALKVGLAELNELVRLTRENSKAGERRQADTNRATTRLQLLTRKLQAAQGEALVASANLARLLAVDPSVPLKPSLPGIVPMRLVDENAPLESLLEQALRSRPELAARNLEVELAQARVRQESIRPFLPTVTAGFSAGQNGGGSNLVPYQFAQFNGRVDVDVLAVWTLQNIGFGNIARRRGRVAEVGQATATYLETVTTVREEVTAAITDAQAAAAQLEAARRQVKIAREGLTEDIERVKSNLGRPLEALDSFQQWNEARLMVVRRTMEHNIAQFRLWVAMGMTPTVPPTSPTPPPPPG